MQAHQDMLSDSDSLGENRRVYLPQRETTWVCLQQTVVCCSSWTVSFNSKIKFASQRLQLGVDLWFQVAVSLTFTQKGSNAALA